MSTPLPDRITDIDPDEAWQAWQPTPPEWDAKWSAHLFRRAGFGASPERIAAAIEDGHAKTLKRLLDGEPGHEALDDVLTDVGKTFALRNSINELRGWWLYGMLNSGHPLRERMTLFWHNHFATSFNKVRSTELMYRQNQLLRKHSLRRFGPLLRDISEDVAMLLWLDSNDNVKGHPNENYAREVMELFSLGVGNYSEKDVQEAARAFTGWHTNPERTKFAFDSRQHDDGIKTVLGETGTWNGDDIVRIVLRRPAASRFLVGKLYRELVSEEEPPRALLEPLVGRFRKSDYDIADLVGTMLASRLFYSEHAFRKKIKSPIDFVLGAVQEAWPGRVGPTELVVPLDTMGQALFAPPNVAGWPGGLTWLNTATLLERNQFADRIAMGRFNGGKAKPVPTHTGYRPTTVPSPAYLEEKPKKTAFPSPTKLFDVAQRIENLKSLKPRAIADRLVDRFMPGGIEPSLVKKVQTFLAKGKPKEDELRHRVREAAHALMCMAEYQLA